MPRLPLLFFALTVAAAYGEERANEPLSGDQTIPPIHLGASSAAGVLFGRDTLSLANPSTSSVDVYIDVALEGRIGVLLPGRLALGLLPSVSYAFTQGDDGVSSGAFTLLAGLYLAYYLNVDWPVVPFARVDNALRWNRTTASTPAAGAAMSDNFGYLANLDLGGAWFVTPSIAVSSAVRGTLFSRTFTDAARVNWELAFVAGIDLFLLR